MENAKPLQEVAKVFGVTDNQLRYWLKLLGEKPVREGKLRFVNPETESRIKEMVDLIRQGTSPAEASIKVKGIPIEKAIIPQEKNDSLEEIRKVLMLLVEENRQMKTHITAIREDNAAFRFKIDGLTKLLEAPKTTIIPQKDFTPAPIRAKVETPPAKKREPIQRELSTWESVQLTFNDCMGFLFGRG